LSFIVFPIRMWMQVFPEIIIKAGAIRKEVAKDEAELLKPSHVILDK
jgi:hypothetical protein